MLLNHKGGAFMKKLIAILLMLILVLSACSNPEQAENPDNSLPEESKSELESSENKDEESYTEFDLSSKAEMCISTFEALAYEKGVSVISAITPDMRFYGNEDDIEHIISPLTDNAIKHTPQGGKVYVTLLSERNEAVIRVHNEGEPIPDEDIDKIFDRFYRVDKARNRSEKRFGLGLSIVKAIAEKYGGDIGVKCENGLTTFTVKLKR